LGEKGLLQSRRTSTKRKTGGKKKFDPLSFTLMEIRN